MNFIVNEMLRVPKASKHVDDPKLPIILHGSKSDIEMLPNLLQARALVRRDSKGRKQRSDTPLLMGMIFSFPSKIINESYLLWEQDTIDFTRRRFGDQAVAIVRHEDESNMHLHVLVHNNGASVHNISPGYFEKKRSRQSLIGFQDAYHSEVAKWHNLARTGPRREREPSNKIYKEMKKEMELVELELSSQRIRLADLKAKNAVTAIEEDRSRKSLDLICEELNASLAKREQANIQQRKLEKQQQELEGREQALNRKIAALHEVEKEQFHSKISKSTVRARIS